MVRPASPLLPARCSFAKVPELGSWALSGAAGHAIGDTPGNSRGSLQVLSQREPRDCADMLQPTALGCCSPLFPALLRDVPTRPVFDLGTPHNLYAEGTLLIAQWTAGFPSPSPSCGVLDSPSLLWVLCKAIEKMTGASLRELFLRTCKPVLPVPSVLLDTVPQSTFPKPRVLSSLELKTTASAHGGPDTEPGVKSKEK